MPGSLTSLDTASSSSDYSYDSDDEEYRLALQEWEESVEQLQQLLSIVVFPYLGRWIGRKWSHWAYARYLRLGLGQPFFFGERTTKL